VSILHQQIYPAEQKNKVWWSGRPTSESLVTHVKQSQGRQRRKQTKEKEKKAFISASGGFEQVATRLYDVRRRETSNVGREGELKGGEILRQRRPEEA